MPLPPLSKSARAFFAAAGAEGARITNSKLSPQELKAKLSRASKARWKRWRKERAAQGAEPDQEVA